MIEKLAEKQQKLNSKIKQAIHSRDNDALNKYAAGLNELLMYYTYTQGHARRIFGNLQGEEFEIIDENDSRVEWDYTRERISLRYHLQPEYMQIGEEAMAVQSWGGPYLTRVNGNTVTGHFSKLISEEVNKKVEEVAVYPFDIIEFFKEQTIKQILEKEDRVWYTGLYGLVRNCERTVGRQTSIVTVQEFSNFDNSAMIRLGQKHVSPAKRWQPKEFMIMPEGVYLEFGNIPQTSIDRLSRDAWDGNMATKDQTNLYGCKVMRVDDAKFLTCSADANYSKFYNTAGTGKWAKAAYRYSFFGYYMPTVMDYTSTGVASIKTALSTEDLIFAALVTDLAVYGIDLGTTKTDYNVDDFTRIIMLPPRNFLGKALLWGSDVKTTLSYQNEHVMFYSSEWLAYILHNKFAVTVLDIWYDATTCGVF